MYDLKEQQPLQTPTYRDTSQQPLPPPPPYTATAYPQLNVPAPPQQYSTPNNPGAAFHPPATIPPTAFLPQGPPPPATTINPYLFPPTFNGYYSWSSLSTFHLGTSATHKSHAVKVHASLFSSKQTLALHAGPTTDTHPVLARVESRGCGSGFVVTVPAQGMDAVVRVEGVRKGMLSEVLRFEVEVGGEKGGREGFEWRCSRGEDVRGVAQGCSFGWKLVRLGDGGGVGGVGEAGGHAVASDGREIVAVVAHNASWSATKGLRFAFLGAGLAGAFGEVWELVAVASALKLWYRDVQQMASAGA